MPRVGGARQTGRMPTGSSQLARAVRLQSHGFRTPADDAASVVERLGAVQAQDLGAAKWVIGSRMARSTPGAIDAALADRRVVRSWPMRGTLHILPTRMLRPTLRLTSPRVLANARRRHEALELGEAEYRSARDAVEHELAGGATATRDELSTLWSTAGIEANGPRTYHLIWWLALDGVLCGGPVDGRVQHFALLDEWAPPGADEHDSPERTLAELFSAYVRGHGPVTLADFAWWSGLTMRDTRIALDGAGDRVERFADRPSDDRPVRYVESGATDAAASRPSGALALAGFDEYYLGYADRSPVCDPRFGDLVIPGGNGVFQPTLVLDGRVVGTWKRTGTAAKPRVELRWFESGSADAAARFERPVRAWARFQGLDLQGIDSTAP
ncbi:winged helix DNA-binding domain-containing protein [Agromyces binzhouensis]|uniref:Winged helix DNA-binding domain-containing protein n=2 Tax=Agromyces binzhouensis TaxID=1817495 RepID=A0A4Q2JYZ0_9MICO|nr:winged helix DNA-binding domain-containing protein [Agromyces binzhouensis]